jgi:predicted metal-dependent hydrolase
MTPAVTPAEAAGIGARLLLDGRPFQAHEVFEDAWKAAPEPDRDLWRGLAQIAVGLTHARRGNPRGAITLLRRGAVNVRGYSRKPAPYGIDVVFVAARADEVADLIERDGLAAVPKEALLLPLGPPPD